MKTKYGLLSVVAALALLALQFFQGHRGVEALEAGVSGDSGVSALMSAYRSRQSHLWVEVEGRVSRIFPDDTKGSRHQRFILRLNNGHTVMVAHNIDLARRVPLSKGDVLRIRGRYEWNARGGVLHWTHHDPRGHIRGGWIEFQGQRYSWLRPEKRRMVPLLSGGFGRGVST